MPTIDELGKQVSEAIQRAARGGDPVSQIAFQNFQELSKILPEGARTAVANAIAARDKAFADTATNLIKSGNDVVDAAQAVGRYIERDVQGKADILSNAERRVREGKVADALWQISVEQLQKDNSNASQLAQENELVRKAMQAAATAYGGPAGAAAFAAWMTYNESGGNIDLALKAGAYAYVMSAGYGSTANLPAGTVGEVAKKAAMTGAVNGLAVAASGGNAQDVTNAFVQGGGSVIVQSAQSYVTKNYVDPAVAKVDSYCTTALGMKCRDAKTWVDQKQSAIQKKLDAAKAVAAGRPSVKITRNGQWAVSWNAEALKSPQASNGAAVVLTYIGQESSYGQHLTQLVDLSRGVRPAAPGAAARPEPSRQIDIPVAPGEAAHWTAVQDVGNPPNFFARVLPTTGPAYPRVGDILRANRDINIRPAPAKWDVKPQILRTGTLVTVLEVRVLDAQGTPQSWIRIAEVER